MGLPTPFQQPQAIDFFSTTLNGGVASGDGAVATLTAVTNSESTPVTIPSTGYMLIDPLNLVGLKELTRYGSLNVGAKTVVLEDRGLSGTLDQSHLTGVTVYIVVNAAYLDDVIDFVQNVTTGHHHDGTDSRRVSLSSTVDTIHAKVKSAAQVLASDSLTADSDLTFTVANGEKWTFEFDLYLTSTTNSTFSVGVSGVAGAAGDKQHMQWLRSPGVDTPVNDYISAWGISSAGANTSFSDYVYPDATTTVHLIVSGVLNASAGGTVAMKYTNANGVTILAGSKMTAHKLL